MLDNGCCGGTFQPRSEEEAWNWVVVRGSTARPADFFWSSPFLRDTMPSHASCYVPEGTNVKKLCKWGVFPSEDVQLVKRRLCGVDGRGGCKNASTVRGKLSFHQFLAKEEQRREWIVKICRKNTPTYTKHPCLWCPLRWRETSRYFSVPARFVQAKPAKKERLSHVNQAARFLDEVEMDVDGNISREAGRLHQIFRGSWWRGRSRLFGRQRSRPPIGVEN